MALGVAELAAALISANSAPVIAVGETAINLTPIPVKEFAITHFGSHDKEALLAGIVVMLIVFAALIGIAAVRRIGYGLAGLAVFAAVGAAAAVHLPGGTAIDVIPTLAGVLVGAGAMVVLIRALWAAFPSTGLAPTTLVPTTLAPEELAPEELAPEELAPEELAPEELAPEEGLLAGPDAGPAGGDIPAEDIPAEDVLAEDVLAEDVLAEDVLAAGPYLSDLGVPAGPYLSDLGVPAGPDARDGSSPDRRRFLIAGAGAAALAAVAGGAGDKLLSRFSIASSRAQVRLPAAAVRAPAIPAGAELNIPGLTPFFTSNSGFYRVDTDLVLPQISPDNWTLSIDGMVDHPLEFSFDELLRMPLTQTDITLVCVSNQVGGTYNGNARWLGVPLGGLLRKAGVQAGADQVLSTSTDGMTISTPVTTILDRPDSLLAVGMNGQPLPIEHGFPARMIVPGLYGYVSATKWVTKLTLTTFAKQKAYWTQRGYSAQAPIKTESRIDVPKPLAQVPAGRTVVAGVAWAPATGIAAVEVNVDKAVPH
jgi:DMSO/TMAO reductase YedYZ molybdopterin-dependent catalytic subunit